MTCSFPPHVPSPQGFEITYKTHPQAPQGISFFFFFPAKLRLTRLDIPEMFKWGKREKQHFFKPTLCIRDKQKLAQGQKNPKKFKNICEIILNTANVPDGKVPSCTEDPSPHAEYCTFLEGAVEQGVRIDKPPHRAASLTPSTPWGQCHHRHHPRQRSGSAGTSLPLQAGGEP